MHPTFEIDLSLVSRFVQIKQQQVEATARLLADGCTLPFIARYRKEVTGGLDEIDIGKIQEEIGLQDRLNNRKLSVYKSLCDIGVMTRPLKDLIISIDTLARLEDVYLPYKPVRRTRASIAKGKGLEPLAKLVWAQGNISVELAALQYINVELEVESVKEALSGARDIMAEWISVNATARNLIRDLYWSDGVISSRVIREKDEAGSKYRDYFAWDERVSNLASHRVLAVFRGEKERCLTVSIAPPINLSLDHLYKIFVKRDGEATDQVKEAIQDAYKRLLRPSIETEVRKSIKLSAEKISIEVFAKNVEQLLLSPPLGSKRIMAIDPGFRTGCKLACLGEQGQVLSVETIFPLFGVEEASKASSRVISLIARYGIDAIAVGNGTGGKETEAFLKNLDLQVPVISVNESGASVYSASLVARSEFPDLDITLRSAISIGRRLLDPLSELVKLDPRSIGVGQYQHEVDQKNLSERLSEVVGVCVNKVGVELNSASQVLLSYVSGINKSLAKDIVTHREKHGPFQSRKELKLVTGIGAKTFEQCVGFLRIKDGTDPLDASAVHPESYELVSRMADDAGIPLNSLIGDSNIKSLIDPQRYVSHSVGLSTVTDIINELEQPGRDPRQSFQAYRFDPNINQFSDLSVGMRLDGVVTNVTNFGAFVDIGVHQDGLVHISELSEMFVASPFDIVQPGQEVLVNIIGLDSARNRISLSMKTINLS